MNAARIGPINERFTPYQTHFTCGFAGFIGGDVTLVAQLRTEHKVIGSVRLWTADAANRTAEIGYTFNRRYWSNGYATEAASALLERADEWIERATPPE